MAETEKAMQGSHAMAFGDVLGYGEWQFWFGNSVCSYRGKQNLSRDRFFESALSLALGLKRYFQGCALPKQDSKRA